MSLDVRRGETRVTGRYTTVKAHVVVVMMGRLVARGRSGGHDRNPGHGLAAVTRVDMPVFWMASRKTTRRGQGGNGAGYEAEGDEQEKRA